ncbi:hypothetical protein AZ78_0979 [Lysobacter capsici AZ78]|uniref:Uncharacterized protein n=1 Tax=Lysobacter capsici AZ78 TaxID=1444315 RepID=A0A108U6G1_9GAMM|nr:hypothetical protein AZ78_0979 [Lysobacter capsici AZ78]
MAARGKTTGSTGVLGHGRGFSVDAARGAPVLGKPPRRHAPLGHGLTAMGDRTAPWRFWRGAARAVVGSLTGECYQIIKESVLEWAGGARTVALDLSFISLSRALPSPSPACGRGPG